ESLFFVVKAPSMAEAYYDRCPKCAHTPLPVDQALPAACPACGIILAKFAAIERQSESSGSTVAVVAEEPPLTERLRALLTDVPEKASAPVLAARAALLL